MYTMKFLVHLYKSTIELLVKISKIMVFLEKQGLYILIGVGGGREGLASVMSL